VRLSAALEKQRYSFHQNHLEDKNYVHFLQPAVQAVKKFSAPGSRGLDYGCGPQPVLAELLRQVGYRVSAYDPFFYPLDLGEIMPLDFITCTEAAEHFFNPGQEFKRIFSLLKPEGSLILMTGLYRENLKIQDWHYGRDPTHVVFFCEATLQWIAHQFQRSCQLTFPNLAVF
jgi:2-polyprenyl-3-methyl-5-hydroxy-6-metoxy-1,4-benzoquinol methylase